jgi:hypothetical protein
MKKNERNAGAKPKFPNIETEVLHIRKIVPKGQAKPIKETVNQIITKLQNDALDKCVAEVLKNK